MLLLVALLAATPTEDEVDHLALAALLLRDGHVDRAWQSLGQVDPRKPETDQRRYHTLRGIVAFRRQDCTASTQSLDAAFALGEAHADLSLMRADCAWRMGERGRALEVLAEGARRFPDDLRLPRTRVRRLLELGLYQQAAEEGRATLYGLDDHLFLAESMLGGRQFEAAKRLLEAARLVHGDDLRLLVQSAHAWLGAGDARTAASFFERAALQDLQYARDAAELYRRAGSGGRALALNGRIPDAKERARQRVAILLDMQRFEAVVSMGPRLSRLELLDGDEDLRYALAYALLQTGDTGAAEAQLQRLTRPDLFDKATELRRQMLQARP